MKRYPYFRAVWIACTILILTSLILMLIGIAWEHSTERYLKGFAEAIVPLSAPPAEKAEAILSWMRNGPARKVAADTESFAHRDPENTLEYKQLLQVCGTATNAFINLAASSGLPARRLLLLDEKGQAKHVVAEIRMDGQWVVADPTFRVLFRNAQGQYLTRQQLQDPATLREATAGLTAYSSHYTYERVAHVRLTRIPLLGGVLGKVLNTAVPGWDEAMNWTLVLERESMALALGTGFMLAFFVGLRFYLSRYARRKLGIDRVRLREHLSRARQVLFSNPR